MMDQPLYILAENNLRLVIFTDTHDFAKQCSTSLAVVVIFKTLMTTSNRKRLAREPRKADVKRRDVMLVDFCDVTFDRRKCPKVCFICLLCILVPLGYKYRLSIRECLLKP